MNRTEVIQILAIIKVAYPNSYNNFGAKDNQALVALWEMQFKDYEANKVMQAINTIIATDSSAFCPSIGRIKEEIYKLSNDNEMSEINAWNAVRKALRNSMYNSTEEFKKLPKEIQDTLGSATRLRELASLTDSEIEFAHNGFAKNYNEILKRKKEQAMIPTSIKNQIGMTKEKMIEE